MRTFGLILVLLLILPEFVGVAGVWLAVAIAELLTMWWRWPFCITAKTGIITHNGSAEKVTGRESPQS